MNLKKSKFFIFLLVGFVCIVSLIFSIGSEVKAQMHEGDGIWLNSENGNVFGDSMINPMADPMINPMGDAYIRNDGSMGLKSQDPYSQDPYSQDPYR